VTRIQEVLLEVERDYMGHPYYVSGHAIYSALARRVSTTVARALQVSTGVFVPGTHGSYPASHSQSGGRQYMGTSLQPVKSYADLFLFRDGAQRWVSDSVASDAVNTHSMVEYGSRTAYAPEHIVGQPAERRAAKETTTWYVHCYLHCSGDTDDVVPLDEEVLDGLRLGGARNYGFGWTSLKETQIIDLDELEYTALRGADEYRIELLSPYVLTSEYPDADEQDVPWWWGTDEQGLRRRTAQLVKGDDVYTLETVDHGQVVDYTGDEPVQTARNGIVGVGTHAKFGFGAFRLRPVSEDRVAERADGGQKVGQPERLQGTDETDRGGAS
jgi:hypothetical protein